MTGIRGSQSGTTYSRNRGGTYRKNKPVPSNPQSGAQGTIRGALGGLSTGWAALTQAQRNGWDTAADDVVLTNSLGEEYNPSGQNLYIAWNSLLDYLGESTNAAWPGTESIEALSAVAASAAVTGTVVSVEFSPTVPSDRVLIIYATDQMSAGINSPKNVFSILTTVAATGTSPEDVATAWTNKYGALVEGKKIFFDVQLASTTNGQSGPKTRVSAVVAA